MRREGGGVKKGKEKKSGGRGGWVRVGLEEGGVEFKVEEREVELKGGIV